MFWTCYNVWMPKCPYSLKCMFGSFLKKTLFHKLQLQQMNMFLFLFPLFLLNLRKKKNVIIPQWKTLHFLIKKYISAGFHHTVLPPSAFHGRRRCAGHDCLAASTARRKDPKGHGKRRRVFLHGERRCKEKFQSLTLLLIQVVYSPTLTLPKEPANGEFRRRWMALGWLDLVLASHPVLNQKSWHWFPSTVPAGLW